MGWPGACIVERMAASSVLTDTVCASGRDGRILGAREGLRAGAVKAEGCSPSRNSDQVKLYLGGTVPKVVWPALADTRPLVPGRPRAKRLRRLAARTALTLPAGYCQWNIDAGDAVLHFAPSNWH